MDYTVEPRMKIVLDPGASKILTFLPLETGALPNFCPEPWSPGALEPQNPLEGLDNAFALFKCHEY